MTTRKVLPVENERPHRIMTTEEYQCFQIKGWHSVCRDVDGCGNVGIRYIDVSDIRTSK